MLARVTEESSVASARTAPVAAERREPVPRPTVVDVRGLSLTYETADGPVYALADVDLQVAEGEFVSFIGPSGCGKTTLLRVVADLEQASGGHVTVNGLTPEQARLKRAYGFIFQAPALYPWRTIRRNVELPLEIFGIPKAERRERARRYLELVNLKGFEGKYPWQLSGGMQQRVGLARAFAHDPDVLLMDEPFGALDAQTRLLLQQTLLEQWEQTAKTVVFVTHSIEEALLLGDRVCVMSARPGQLIHTVHVPFPRPREGVALYKDPRWGPLYEDVWSVLRDEVDRSRREEVIV